MRSLKSLIGRDIEISGLQKSESKIKKIRSPGGQERFVPGYIVDYEFQADKTQTEKISLGNNADWAHKHFYTLKTVKRDRVSPAIAIEDPRERPIKDLT